MLQLRAIVDLEAMANDFTIEEWFYYSGGARGVTVIVLGNEHGDTSSNPGPDWLHFT